MNTLKDNDLQNSWSWIKKQTGLARTSTINLPVIDTISKKLIDDNIEKLEIWKNHFQKLSTKEEYIDETEANYIINPLLKEISDSPITKDEIVYELKRTRNNKAAGEDNIPSEFYKIIEKDSKLESRFLTNVLKIFNKILDEGNLSERMGKLFNSPNL